MIEQTNLRTINSKLFNLGSNTRRLVTSMGVLHYPEANGSWSDIDESDVTIDIGGGGFTKQYNKCFHHVRTSEDGTRRIYPNRYDSSYWIEIGKPFASMSTPLVVGNTWIWDFAHATIKLQFQGGAVKFNAILKDALAPTSITIPFTSQGITRSGRILYHDGVPVAELRKASAIDAMGRIRVPTTTFNAGSITLSLNTTGLTFPIDIDPTINLQVGGSDGDAYYRYSDFAWDLTNPNNAIGYVSAPNSGNGFPARFTGVTIPKGATITNAVAILTSNAILAGDNCNARISAEGTDNASVFSTSADFDTRYLTKTTARIDWNTIAHTVTNTEYTSPDIKTVIQEIVDRAGWVSGNALALFIEDFDFRSTAGANCYRNFYSYDADTLTCPKLDITYTVPAAYYAGGINSLFIYKGRGLTAQAIKQLYLNPYDMFLKS